ncbi:Iron hydrogenase 1 [Anaerohalosphaera lusitana]|uniref:Iron hydrogenase 1 n=1 Tax=Anaerohalosphaera lusitana TaxID=1936003 RepID=A0A1U9NMK9_9BACT|nr:[Fe-Fe] hydrogenase large subunit C-terminal domain-containing protein [Anaerohalosphaera lusitana]AQT68974.1 Iron hydrogenase 1 [Anaerohalosphaera lusitana]
MNQLQPIFTEPAECQDCYKCLRQCSVKGIKIQEGHARIIPELCVMCGKCVQVCPVGAKRVRNDLDRAKLLLQMKKKVIVSLAPSFVSEFAGIEQAQLIAGIKRLGFYGVSETALGAQEVSATIAKKLKEENEGVYISSACPTVVELVKKYRSEHAEKVTSLLSPVLAHTKLLRRQYGEDVGVVFVGPCISKKAEADSHGEMLEVAITFEELREWFDSAGIEPGDEQGGADDDFIPYRANEGALYPIDGGMIAGIKRNCSVSDSQLMTFSGIENIEQALGSLEEIKTDGPMFIEMLACEGGCVNGPKAGQQGKTIVKRSSVLSFAQWDDSAIPREPGVEIEDNWLIEPVRRMVHSEEEISRALKTVGKFSREDELNCGGCGYDSCREFARALLDGRAETSMCAGYMRKLAHKKADALIRTMPSGVVIVDEHMRIVESNRRFAELMGEESAAAFDAKPGLEGAVLDRVIGFGNLFSQVLSSGQQSVEKSVRHGKVILRVTVFTIDPHRIVGGIVQDITAPAVQKEQVVRKAKEVITNHLSTVQQIAFLLGENAAESEVILNSITESFSADALGDGTDAD